MIIVKFLFKFKTSIIAYVKIINLIKVTLGKIDRFLYSENNEIIEIYTQNKNNKYKNKLLL